MASTFTTFFFFSLILSISLSSTTYDDQYHHQHLNKTHNSKLLIVSKTTNSSSEIIHQACQATRFPIPCETTLQNHSSSSNLTTIDILNASIQTPIQSLKTVQSMIQTITLLENTSSSSHSAKQNRSYAVKNCLQVLHFSEYRFSLVAENFAREDGKRIKDVRAWMSAALLYQYGCWFALKNIVYDDDMSQRINETMTFMGSLVELTSNALSIMVSYDLFGNDTASWKPPMTERSGFWEVEHDKGGENSNDDYGHDVHFGGFPAGLTANVTVCTEKRDGCDYETIQEAVAAAPEEDDGGRFVIRIREGVYKEIVRVPLKKKNVVFLGDGMGKTVITGSLNVGMHGISTLASATVAVLGDGFMARDITFENTAGPDAHQAVAFRSDSDRSIFESCEFLGNQDTLYASSLRQFYNSCRIEGNIDFIFGNSAAVFENCLILIRPRQLSPEKGEKNPVTAHGRSDPAQSTGFVFRNCVINGTDKYMDFYDSNPKVHKNYLGRPWKEYSRTVFINCYFERLISPQGWMPWDGDFALPTLYYGELNSSGPGAANMSARVEWSSQIPVKHVQAYSLKNFIQGDEWML